MKKSIVFKTFWTILGTLFIIIGVSWLVLNFFVDDYYYNKKMTKLEKTAENVNEVVISDKNDIEKAEMFENYSIESGGDITVLDNNNALIYGAQTRGMGMGKKNAISRELYSIKKNESYITKVTSFSGTNNWYIYAKRFESGALVLVQVPVQQIDEAVDVIKQLFLYMSIFSFVLTIIGSYLLSKNMSKPLIQLNNIAQEMSELNFTMKYTGNRQDEIGQLGRTLNDLTIKLENTISQLQQELQKEKSLDSMRKKFVAQVSHELQTPISIICGYVEALQDNMIESEEDRDFHYEVIQDEANKISKMVKEILDLSQLESGAYKIEKTLFDFGDLVNNIFIKYKEIARLRNIEFEQEGIVKNILVFGDKNRIEQVITNFINNAFVYTSEKGIIKLIIEKNENKIKLNVYNTGNHIQKDEIEYIWESFYKAKDSKKGTGLGLAISKHILHLHGSDFGVENVKDGVNFWFNINKCANKNTN